MSGTFSEDVAIVGGCGNVGVPLGIAFAREGLRTALYDFDSDAVGVVNAGVMPFREQDAQPELEAALINGTLVATTDVTRVGRAENVVIVIGTPVNQYLNPDLTAVRDAVGDILPHLRDRQLVVLRSTVFPGVTEVVERLIDEAGLDIDVGFCPERIAEGHALRELRELPQIIAGCSPRAEERATLLFKNLTDKMVYLEPREAEVAKLMTNTWRYIKFATANQLYMLANDFGLDYEKIRSAVVEDYPRAADLPKAGFAAGPCLLKDTMQLSAFNNNDFTMGQAAMNINEGLPLYVVSQLNKQHDLSDKTVGILGMAFKGDSDDGRWSLSYKLRRILEFHAAEVVCTDPYVADDILIPLDDVLARADLIVIGAPHSQYRGLEIDQPVADVWGILGRGVRV